MASPSINLDRGRPGEIRVSTTLSIGLSGPDIDLSHLDTKDPVVLHPGYGAALLKACGAKHFLDLMQRHRHHQVLATYYFDAFLSLARSVTWALQKECAHLPGFEQWYATWQRRLRQDPRATAFLELRNEAEKEGPHRPAVGFQYEMKHALNGTVRVGQLRAQLRLPRVKPGMDAIAEARGYIELLTELVEDGRRHGYPTPTNLETPAEFGLRYLRETPKGEWVEFTPPHWEPKPEEFLSRRDYDEWRRSLPPRPPPGS